MAEAGSDQHDTHGPGFKQQDASAWISFDPDLTGHRRDVRSAAARSSAAARKATIAKKIALNTGCTASRNQDASKRPRKRRREQQETSPASASSSTTPHSRRQSEISLASLASTDSPISSGTDSPCFMQAPQMSAPMSWELDSSKVMQRSPLIRSPQHNVLQRVITFVLGIDNSLATEPGVKEPTHFGASRVKSRAINSVHDAVGAHQAGSGTLLAVVLLAAWDLVSSSIICLGCLQTKLTCEQRFGDQRLSSLHLGAWHQLAIAQSVLAQQDGYPPARVTLIEAIRLSLQCHLPPDVYGDTQHILGCIPNQHLPTQPPSGLEVVCFFDLVGALVGTNSP